MSAREIDPAKEEWFIKRGGPVEQVGVDAQTPSNAGKLTWKDKCTPSSRRPIGRGEFRRQVAKALDRSLQGLVNPA